MKQFALFFVLIWASAKPQTPFSHEVDSLILGGIDYTFQSQYYSAMVNFKKVTEKYPDHVVGYFYQAATLQSKMMDYESNLWEDEFYHLIEKASQIGEEQIVQGDESAWTYFYLGSVYSYKGLYQAKAGGYVSGFISARKGMDYLKEALQRDSTLYDAYLGVGSYKYWSGRFYKYLIWLPWIKDEREEGIRMVRCTVNRGTFSHWVAVNTLGWIEYDRKNYWEAHRLFQRGLEHYPESRFFLWGIADTYFRLEKYEEAIKVYEDLLRSVQTAPMNNGYNEVVCRFKLVRSYFGQSQYEKALQHSEAILNMQVGPETAERVKGRTTETMEYRKKCMKKLKKQGER